MINVYVPNPSSKLSLSIKSWALKIIFKNQPLNIVIRNDKEPHVLIHGTNGQIIKLKDKVVDDYCLGKSLSPHNLYKLRQTDQILSKFIQKDLYSLDPKDQIYTVNTNESSVIFLPDILGLIFQSLCSINEITWSCKDEYGRYAEEKSIGYELESDPYCCWIDDWISFILIKLGCNHSSQSYQPRLPILTHDVDIIKSFADVKAYQIAKQSLYELAARKWKYYPFDKLFYWLVYNYYPRIEWNILCLFQLAKNYNQSNLDSLFYLLLDPQGQIDIGHYSYSSLWVKKFIKYAVRKNCKIGLHVSYYQSMSKDNYINALERYHLYLKSLNLTAEPYLVHTRNHFLRYNFNEAVSWMEDSNVNIDSSIGYTKRIGWRLGTRHNFRLFNLKKGRESSVINSPFGFMDNVLIKDQYVDLINNNLLLHELNNFLSYETPSSLVVHPHNLHSLKSVKEFTSLVRNNLQPA